MTGAFALRSLTSLDGHIGHITARQAVARTSFTTTSLKALLACMGQVMA